MTIQEKATRRAQTLRTQSKKEVFQIYARTCLGRIFSEDSGIPKSWMIYDILVAEYGRGIADQASKTRYYKIS